MFTSEIEGYIVVWFREWIIEIIRVRMKSSSSKVALKQQDQVMKNCTFRNLGTKNYSCMNLQTNFGFFFPKQLYPNSIHTFIKLSTLCAALLVNIEVVGSYPIYSTESCGWVCRDVCRWRLGSED
jgi:hypothetical protein